MPPRASRRIMSSRMALEKYLAIRPANRFAGSCPYSQVGIASPPLRAHAVRPSLTAGREALPHGQRRRRVRVVVEEVRRRGQHVDRRGEVGRGPAGEVRAEVRRLHDARAAAGDARAGRPGPAPSRASAASRYAARTARHGVPAHDADHRLRRRGRPSQPRMASASALSIAVVVQPLGERLADVRQRAAVRPEVLVDDRVVHAGEAAVGEARRPGRRACTGGTDGSGTAAPGSRGPRARRGAPASASTSGDANRQPTNSVSVTSTPVRSGTGRGRGAGPARSGRRGCPVWQVVVELGPRLDLVGACGRAGASTSAGVASARTPGIGSRRAR